MPKATIIFEDDKIKLESHADIKVKDIISLIRKQYNIPDDHKIHIIAENKSYDEKEMDTTIPIHPNEKKKDEDIVCISLPRYHQPILKEEGRDLLAEKKAQLIKEVTGASQLLKFDKRKKTSRSRRSLNDFLSSTSLRFLYNNPIYGMNPLSHQLLMDDEDSENGESSPETGRNMTGIYPYQFPFLGRARERIGNFYQPQTLPARQEDVNRLVNEMGFPENRVRSALRVTRNNVSRAIDMLLSGEGLEEGDNINQGGNQNLSQSGGANVNQDQNNTGQSQNVIQGQSQGQQLLSSSNTLSNPYSTIVINPPILGRAALVSQMNTQENRRVSRPINRQPPNFRRNVGFRNFVPSNFSVEIPLIRNNMNTSSDYLHNNNTNQSNVNLQGSENHNIFSNNNSIPEVFIDNFSEEVQGPNFNNINNINRTTDNNVSLMRNEESEVRQNTIFGPNLQNLPNINSLEHQELRSELGSSHNDGEYISDFLFSPDNFQLNDSNSGSHLPNEENNE